jgi:RNA polymerase sigma factor (sigma-70 family)
MSDDYLWELYSMAGDRAEKICKKRLYNLGTIAIEECVDYIKSKLEKDNFKLLRDFNIDKSSITTYLFLIINSKFKDFIKIRNGKKRKSIQESIVSDNATYVEDKNLNFDYMAQKILEDVISTLTTEEKLILRFRFSDELKYKEIGAILNKTDKQIAKKVGQIIKKLKKRFKERGYNGDDFLS